MWRPPRFRRRRWPATTACRCAAATRSKQLSHGPEGALRYIEVKGRAGTGAVEISENERLKAEQLGEAYWLYIVTEALNAPAFHVVQDPAHRLPREEIAQRVRKILASFASSR